MTLIGSETIQKTFNSGIRITSFALLLGFLYSIAEYYYGIWIEDPRSYVPLMIRVIVIAIAVGFSITIFEVKVNVFFRKKRFAVIVFLRSIVYTFIITFWLAIINGIWESIDYDISFFEGIKVYLSSGMYLPNLVTLMVFFILILGIVQITDLHRKRELRNFILGRYHQPKEIKRLFCFIDLNHSTSIAEKLGNLKFGSFLKDYYSDLTDAIRLSGAEVYQYVGDEIILSWPDTNKTNYSRVLSAIFIAKQTIQDKKEEYLSKYGTIPSFKAGLHGGMVLVTWVGETKKEVIYLGDVLNTTSRIQGECKRLKCDCLISEYVHKKANHGMYAFTFKDELVPRGKEKSVKVYTVEERVSKTN